MTSAAVILIELSAGVSIRQIKIDRAFVMNLGRNPQSAGNRSGRDRLGHGLEMSIVAEGVETQEPTRFPRDQGCDAVQGYFIGKPAPIGQYGVLVDASAAIDPSPRARPAKARIVPIQLSNSQTRHCGEPTGLAHARPMQAPRRSNPFPPRKERMDWLRRKCSRNDVGPGSSLHDRLPGPARELLTEPH